MGLHGTLQLTLSFTTIMPRMYNSQIANQPSEHKQSPEPAYQPQCQWHNHLDHNRQLAGCVQLRQFAK